MKGLNSTSAMLFLASCSATALMMPGAASAQNADHAAAAAPARSDTDGTEIVVTARKVEERLMDVPAPVSVVNAQNLVETGQVRLQDFYTRVPGLVVSPLRANNAVTIRGVTSGGQGSNPTVGITIDDLPYGASTQLGGGLQVPDFDPSDLARIEVLRGPQGTLYGASSMGGLIRFVTVDPDPTRVSGRLQAGAEMIHGGDNIGFNVRGSLNLPLTDTVAVRASGFYRETPGFIDNVRTGEDDVNAIRNLGGRISVLFRPSSDFSLRLSAQTQHAVDDGSSDVDILPGLGELQQSRLPGTGWVRRNSEVYSAVLRARLASVSLTSVTGYGINTGRESLDFGFQVGAQIQALYGVNTAEITSRIHAQKFSQEIRAEIPLGDSVDWLIGGFYTRERSLLTQDIFAINPTTSANILPRWSNTTLPTAYREYAAFSNLTVRLGDRFDIQFGGRYSWLTTSSGEQVQSGPRFPTTPRQPPIDAKSNVFTYLVTPRYHVTDNFMIYGRLSSGYRTGGPNGGAAVALGLVPPSYAPDQTRNYELGLKGYLFGRVLMVDLSLYYIDWKNIQLTLLNSATSQFYTGNAARAKSEGVELAAELRPTHGLTIGGWVSYGDAVLTDPIASTATVYGASGDRLPLSPRWSANLSANWEFPLSTSLNGFVGGNFNYVGRRIGLFRGLAGGLPLPRQVYDDFTKIDLNAGFETGQWRASVFATNVTDSRGQLNGGLSTQPPFAFQIIQPRTIGLSLARAF